MRLTTDYERERSGGAGMFGGSRAPLRKAIRFPLFLMALGLFLLYVGPVPFLGMLIICGAGIALAMAVIMPWLGG